MKPKPKRRLVFLSLKKKSKKNFKFLKSPIEDSINILSPYNTSQFLISNNSDPFYPEEEDDLDIEINPNSFLPKLYPDSIKNEYENIEMKDSHLELLELASTAAQSQDYTDRKLSFE